MHRLFLILAFLFSLPVHSQSWRLPPDEPNTRYYPDYAPPSPALAVRPKLSMHGFDRSDGKAHGVKQVLSRAFGTGGSALDNDTQRLFQNIALAAGQDEVEHYEIGRCAEDECVTEMHAEHLEAQAFIALMSFVISLNDGDRTGEPTLFTPTVLNRLALPDAVFPRIDDDLSKGVDHKEARDRLLATLRKHKYIAPYGAGREFVARYADENSPFKTHKSLFAVARALDLYWALENGYLWANANGYTSADYDISKLMTQAETASWVDVLNRGISTMWEGTLRNHAFGINANEVQAGNWPLQGFMGAAYAVMGMKTGVTLPDGETSCYFYADEPPYGAVTEASPDIPSPEATAGEELPPTASANHTMQAQAASHYASECNDVLSAAIRHSGPTYGSYYG